MKNENNDDEIISTTKIRENEQMNSFLYISVYYCTGTNGKDKKIYEKNKKKKRFFMKWNYRENNVLLAQNRCTHIHHTPHSLTHYTYRKFSRFL